MILINTVNAERVVKSTFVTKYKKMKVKLHRFSTVTFHGVSRSNKFSLQEIRFLHPLHRRVGGTTAPFDGAEDKNFLFLPKIKT
jgi:hypothetical protein